MIYDCFPFFNELDVLEMRLNILNEVVDKFVIVESTRTFTNFEKPLYFMENRQRFERFLDRIIPVVVGDHPPFTSTWVCESRQRNAIERGLVGASDDDIVIISDVDEIPRPESVREGVKMDGITELEMSYHAFYLNYRNLRNPVWRAAKMLKYGDFKRIYDGAKVAYDEFLPESENRGTTASKIRMRRLPKSRGKTNRLRSAGWHFTCLGGAEAVRRKLMAYSHQELFAERGIPTTEEIEKAISVGESPGLTMHCFAEPIDGRYPAFLRENADRYAKLIFDIPDSYARKVRVARWLRRAQGAVLHAAESLIPPRLHGWLHVCKMKALGRKPA